jgi:hypothetical protein
MQFGSQWPGDAIGRSLLSCGRSGRRVLRGSWRRVVEPGRQSRGSSRLRSDRGSQQAHRTRSIVVQAKPPAALGRGGDVLGDRPRNRGLGLVRHYLAPGILSAGQRAGKERETGKRRLAPRSESDPSIICGTGTCGPLPCFETARSDVAGRRTWIISITSFFSKLWSRMLRECEIRHISAAWERVDDRALKDIGISARRSSMEEMRDIGADATVVARLCAVASMQISACRSP